MSRNAANVITRSFKVFSKKRHYYLLKQALFPEFKSQFLEEIRARRAATIERDQRLLLKET